MPEQDKVEKIVQAPVPETKKQVRAFLGLVGYYRKFCPNFSALALPLTDLTKKDQPEKIQWTPEAEDSFTSLKKAICDQPVLRMPDYDREFILRTDASDKGIGADQGSGPDQCPGLFQGALVLTMALISTRAWSSSRPWSGSGRWSGPGPWPGLGPQSGPGP